MLELIYAIPENIGWVLVGIAGTLCAMMAYKLGKLFVQMWKDRREDEIEGED